mmetsp:Transcript_6442/g.19026  ORF Transcript_6442/g.19026 Transcript_6442/m.19026 type:complete len:1003 (+) Transcript_6442:88-3096(+)
MAAASAIDDVSRELTKLVNHQGIVVRHLQQHLSPKNQINVDQLLRAILQECDENRNDVENWGTPGEYTANVTESDGKQGEEGTEEPAGNLAKDFSAMSVAGEKNRDSTAAAASSDDNKATAQQIIPESTETKEQQPESTDDVLIAIEKFVLWMEETKRDDISLGVKVEGLRAPSKFSVAELIDVCTMTGYNESEMDFPNDEEKNKFYATEYQKLVLGHLREDVTTAKQNEDTETPIKEIHITEKIDKSVIILQPGIDDNIAATLCEFIDDKEKPFIMEVLKKEMDAYVNKAVNGHGRTFIPSLVTPVDKFDSESLFPPSGKTVAFVVGGESGCGKTWFSSLGIRNYVGEEGAYLLYLSMSQMAIDPSYLHPPEAITAIQRAIQTWRKAISWAAQKYYWSDRTQPITHNGDFIKKRLSIYFDHLHILNSERNEWAQQIFNRMIDSHKGSMFRKWKAGESQEPIDKLIIVIDEVGANLEFARGIIDSHRDYIAPKFGTDPENEHANKCAFVLSGAGLDIIQKEYATIGTDPNKYKLVWLKAPDVKAFSATYKNQLLDIDEAEAILEAGTLSSNMMSNTRVLMCGIQTIFDSEYLQEDISKHEYKTLLKTLFSLPEFMTKVFEKYVKLNGMRNMQPPQRREYFQCSFKYVLQQSIIEILKKGYKQCVWIDRLNIGRDVDCTRPKEGDRDLFSLGIATADITKMSTALLLFACRFQAHPVWESDGASLEVMVKYLVRRILEVAYKDDGARIEEYKLKQLWPNPQGDNNATETKKIVSNNNYLQDYRWVPTDEHDADFQSIAEIMRPPPTDTKSPEAKAVLISQRDGDNAQGPDMFVLERDANTKNFDLFLMQIKNYKKAPTIADAVSTLGAVTVRKKMNDNITGELKKVVEYNGDKDKFVELLNDIHDLNEKAIADKKASFVKTWNDVKRAFRVQDAITTIKETLQTKLREHGNPDATVTIKDRILVCRSKDELDAMRSVDGVCLWSKEYIEPTYGCMSRQDKKQK